MKDAWSAGLRPFRPARPSSLRIHRLLVLGLAAALACTALAPLGCSSRPGPNAVGWGRNGGQYPVPEADLRATAAHLLSESVKMDTSNPPGDEAALARYLAGYLDRAGIETRVVETTGPDRAALWARVPGSGRAPPLVLLSHLDTVPASRTDWDFDPFSGSVGAGYVVGRGTLDAKGVAIVHVLTLVALTARGAPLDRDVILLAVPDEETGGRQGAGVLVRARPDLLQGARTLLTEGGGIVPGEGLGPEIWGVSFTEKTPCWLEVVASGVPGHGSAPVDSSVDRLLEALDRIRNHPTPLRVVPDVATMFASVADLAVPEDRAHYLALGRALASDPAFRERFLSDPGRRALVRDTLTVTVLEGASRVNVIPETARARIDARILPDRACADLASELRARVDDPAVRVDVVMTFPPSRSPIDTPLFESIRRVAARQQSPARVVPRVIAGFTDAHWFRELGVHAYGFVPRRLRPTDTLGIHGPNERVSVDNLELGVTLLLEILEELDRVERGE